MKKEKKQKNVFVVRVENFLPELCKITVPTIEKYAQKIGANFVEITERKFPGFPPTYEKMQVFELGNGADWNILIDADYLISPSAPDFTLGLSSNYVSSLEAYDARKIFRTDSVFEEDGRYIGIAANFVITDLFTHNLWQPGVEDWGRARQNLLMREVNIDEYCISHNLSKYHYSFTGLNYSPEIRNLFVHLNVGTDFVEEKDAIKKALIINEKLNKMI